MEGEKLLNKVVIYFFAHKKYSRSFIKIWLNHWCHMDYFNDVLTIFLGLERGSCIAVYAESYKALGFHQKYLDLCSKDERRSYRFGTGLSNSWQNKIFWVNYLFNFVADQCMFEEYICKNRIWTLNTFCKKSQYCSLSRHRKFTFYCRRRQAPLLFLNRSR